MSLWPFLPAGVLSIVSLFLFLPPWVTPQLHLLQSVLYCGVSFPVFQFWMASKCSPCVSLCINLKYWCVCVCIHVGGSTFRSESSKSLLKFEASPCYRITLCEASLASAKHPTNGQQCQTSGFVHARIPSSKDVCA